MPKIKVKSASKDTPCPMERSGRKFPADKFTEVEKTPYIIARLRTGELIEEGGVENNPVPAEKPGPKKKGGAD